MGTVSPPSRGPRSEGRKTGAGWPAIALVVVVAGLGLVGLRGFLKSRPATPARTAEAPSATLQGVVPAPLEDVASAQTVLDGYLKAASMSDARKLFEFSGVEEGHPIVGGYKILRDEGCTTETGSAQEVRGVWERIRSAGESEKSGRALREMNVDWHGLAPTEEFRAFSVNHPLLAGAVSSDAGLALFPENAFAVDGRYEVESCSFVVDLEVQSKTGTRLWKREHVTVMKVATAATTPRAGRWLVIGRQEVGR